MTKTNTEIQDKRFDWIPENVKSFVDYIPLAKGLGVMIAFFLAIVALTLLF